MYAHELIRQQKIYTVLYLKTVAEFIKMKAKVSQALNLVGLVILSGNSSEPIYNMQELFVCRFTAQIINQSK